MSRVTINATVRPWGPDGAYVDIPGSAARRLGARDRLDVVARVNGVTVRKSLALRAGDVFRMALGKAVRERAHVAVGDDVTVELDLDAEGSTARS